MQNPHQLERRNPDPSMMGGGQSTSLSVRRRGVMRGLHETAITSPHAREAYKLVRTDVSCLRGGADDGRGIRLCWTWCLS